MRPASVCLRILNAALALTIASAARTEAEWRESAGYRTKALRVTGTRRAGFSELDPATTGVLFTNRLSERSIARNSLLANGSGVALGDLDGDGRCDIYFCRLEGANVLYRNLGNLRFEDITARAGVGCSGQASTGAACADLDGDGDLDLLVNACGGGTRLFLNDGQAHFVESTDSGLAQRYGSTSLALADVDGDGDLDLYVTNYRTRSHKDESPPIPIEVHRIGGRLVVSPEDRFVAIGLRPGGVELAEKGEPDILYLNDGHGRFTAVPWTGGDFLDAEGRPLAAPPFGWGLSALFRDLDGNGTPDLYVCNDFVYWPDDVWLNRGPHRFQAIDGYALRNCSMSSMAVDAADINRDGHDDLFVVEMLRRTHADRQRQRENRFRRDMRRDLPVHDPEFRPEVARNALFLNRGDGTYAEIAQFAGLEASDWSWSAVFVDVDLDGYEDLLIVNGHNHDAQDFDTLQAIAQQPRPDSLQARLDNLRRFPSLRQSNVAFRNRGDLTFEDYSRRWGFDALGISQGMALADLDEDGDLDVVINNLHSHAAVIRNESTAPRLAVRLRGQPPNTLGIGAKIRVRGGPVMQSQEMICGGRYLSSDDAVRVFAAGSDTNALDLEVDWRSGRQSRITAVPANHLIEIHEPTDTTAENKGDTGEPPDTPFFEDLSAGVRHRHHDEPFDDLERQPLLPRKLSGLGPGVGWIDLDADGLDDLVIGGGAGGLPGIYRNTGAGQFAPFATPEPLGPLPRDQTAVVAWPAPAAMLALLGLSNYEDGVAAGPAVVGCAIAQDALRWFDFIPATASSVGPLALATLGGNPVLFVGGRVLPGRYPEPAGSTLYRWEGHRWNLDANASRLFERVGLVSAAVWSDLAGSGQPDLILACEWGPIRVFRQTQEGFREITADLGLEAYTGWWNGVASGDFDGDGLPDLVASNWGRNTKYESYRTRDLEIHYGDFHRNGRVVCLETYFETNAKQQVPWAALDIVALAMPEIPDRLKTARSYGHAGILEILGDYSATAQVLSVNTLESVVFMNRGPRLQIIALPVEAQFAPAFGVAVTDFDGDGHDDLFLAQNFFGVDPETSRYDAGRGLWLRGQGNGEFVSVPGQLSGIRIPGEQRGCAVSDFDGDGRVDLAVAQNHHETKLYRNLLGQPGLRVRFRSPTPLMIGASLRLRFGSQLGPIREIQAGSGYWSQNSLVPVLAAPSPPTALWIRWPGGKETQHPIPPGRREIEITPN